VRPKRTRRGIILAITDLARALSCVDAGDFSGAASWVRSSSALLDVALGDAMTIKEKIKRMQKQNLMTQAEMQREIDRAMEKTSKRLARQTYSVVETGE